MYYINLIIEIDYLHGKMNMKMIGGIVLYHARLIKNFYRNYWTQFLSSLNGDVS